MRERVVGGVAVLVTLASGVVSIGCTSRMDAAPDDGGHDAAIADAGWFDARESSIDAAPTVDAPAPLDAPALVDATAPIDAYAVDAPPALDAASGDASMVGDAASGGWCLGACTGTELAREPRECFNDSDASSFAYVRDVAEMNGTTCPAGSSIVGFSLFRAPGGCIRADRYYCN